MGKRSLHIYSSIALNLMHNSTKIDAILKTRIRKDNLVKSSTDENYSWKRDTYIEVKKKGGVKVQLYILPNITTGRARKAKLQVRAKADKRLQKQLLKNERAHIYSVEVNTQVTSSIRDLGTVQNHPKLLDTSSWEVNYIQDLVKCEEVENCADAYLDLFIEIKFITQTRR